jgi:hypothetical protein
MKRTVCAIALCAALACDDDGSGPAGAPYRAVNAFPSLTFSRPTNVVNAGDGTNRLFVTEQTGRILVFANQEDVAAATVFRPSVSCCTRTSAAGFGTLSS